MTPQERRLQVLRSVDKLDRVGVQGVFDLLTEGRRDESGDFTPGCGLSVGQAVGVLAVVTAARDDPASRRLRMLWRLASKEIGADRTALDMLMEFDPPDLGAALDQLDREMRA